MKLSFMGAAREVTGSCHLLEVGGRKILIDCGMKQGSERKDGQDFPFAANSIDCVLITHAHIDHSGRLPLLVKQGFSGRIISTGASCDLLDIMLRDSAHIQESEAEWENRKGRRAGREAVVPLYDMNDAEAAIELLSSCDYNELVDVAEGVRARFVDAGHLLGSASVEVWAEEAGETKKIVFSGDIGNLDQPIINDPGYITEGDYVVMESTYGDRHHAQEPGNHVDTLAEIFDRTLGRGGNVIIPSFAVGRAQEMLYFIREIKEKGLVKSVPDFPVYVDSPLASEALRVFEKNIRRFSDDEAMAIIHEKRNPLRFSGLHITATAEESKALNFDERPKVIISSSGMCEAGRIRHHLKHNLWRKECAVIFVGYQAGGTLGRALLDGAKKVRIFGEEISVRSEIVVFRGVSGHADQPGLIKWIDSFKKKPQMVFAVHGENEVCEDFVGLLASKGYNASAPNPQAAYDLAADRWIFEGLDIEKKTASEQQISPAFAKLLAAANRLVATVNGKAGYSNKDLARITSQIESLITKLE